MMKNNKYIIALFISIFALNANAEEPLSKEIVVEKDYKPTEQKATRPSSTPQVAKIEIPSSNLDFSDWAIPTNSGNQIPVLLPYGYQTSRNFTTNKGYFDFGIGSYWNMVGSAGYKILDKEKTSLGMWIQHNSSWGASNTVSKDITGQDFDIKYIEDWAGVNFSHYLGANKLTADVFYHFGRLNYLHSADLPTPFNNINEFDLNLKFLNNSANESFHYFVGGHFNYFGNGLKEYYKDDVTVSQNLYQLLGGLSYQINENSLAGLNLTGDLLHSSYPIYLEDQSTSSKDSNSIGKLRFNPYYSTSSKLINLRLGLNLDLSVSDGTVFRIAPDINFDFKFINGFSFFVNATGGKSINTYSNFFSNNRYITPFNTLASSYTPIDANLGIKVGPFSGFKAKAWLGYGRTDDSQQMQAAYDYDPSIGTYQLPIGTNYFSMDIKGWYFGGELSYSYKNFATLCIKGEYAKQDKETGYAGMGLDRPEYIFGANLEVKPIAKLSLNLDYELRGNRSVWEYSSKGGAPFPTYSSSVLSDVNNLSLGAHYQINDMIGVFANANNILNKKWELVQFYGAQKFNAMGGITLKF